MKKIKIITAFIMMAVVFNCSFGAANTTNDSLADPIDEFKLLVEYLENAPGYIFTADLPIIDADEVKKNLKNPKYHIIDIRNEAWFEYGHIKGAKNLNSNELLDYVSTVINSTDFEKIILVCYSGQSASYFSSLLRIAGYDNVFSMKWGMSAWREDFAEAHWSKFIGNSYESNLVNAETLKPEPGDYPGINTGQTKAKDILSVRIDEMFKIPYKDKIVKFDEFVANKDDFFILNFAQRDFYELGHISGAINYEPGVSLHSSKDLFTLPVDKKIVVYGDTGLEAAFVVAYLNVLGYDAANLAYGANGFMNNTLKKKNMDAFSDKEINMFPVIE
jgi:rhodanese-related sulfurtransferase